MYTLLKSFNVAALITGINLVVFLPDPVVAQETPSTHVGHSEEGLYNLVKSSCKANNMVSAEKYSKRYFVDFPRGESLNRVKSLMLDYLFHAGEYEKALALSTDVMEGKKLGSLAENSKLHDLCLHVKGGSLYYLGKYAEAQPLLQKHVESYPESKYVLASHYFEAANYSRIQDWHKAAEKLDKFLNDYPDKANNIYYPYALYDRAETYFATMEEYSMEEFNEIHKLLGRIENEFKGSNIDAQSFILRGDVLRVERQKVKSRNYYLKALEVAEQQGIKKDAGHALYKLMSLLVRDDNQAALRYYDKFWKEYPVSDYKPKVAVLGMPLMITAKRGEEGLGNLQRVIAELSQQENAPALESVINSYVKYYLKLGKTLEDLENLLLNALGRPEPRIQALFHIALINLYERLEEKENGNGKKSDKLKLKINLMYRDLTDNFKLTDLSDYLLFRIGNHLIDRKRPKEGLKYFEQILKNGRPELRTRAMYQKATILARLGNVEGLKLLSKIVEDKGKLFEKRTKGKAAFELIKIYVEQGNGKKVIQLAQIYKERGYKNNKGEALFFLARGYEMMKDHDKAISTYYSVYARYRSRWEIAVPALGRASELLWKHGKGLNNKQVAYNRVVSFLRPSARAFAKHKSEMGPKLIKDYEELEELAKKWEKDENIKPK